ncbi:uncharacterized protein [Rutidosis leptorrhynchoides]|uniref:uncharacterized protein n=1 Tax=Rutidosis leptorrhynchoides TaxID=125765 RepID=UPI003A9A3FB7
MRIGYYWTTIHNDASVVMRACRSCQQHMPNGWRQRHCQQLLAGAFETSFGKTLCAVAHPQANEQCELTNRDIIRGIKARLGLYGNEWVDELPSVLWAHYTTHKNNTGETPFSLVYGTEAVIPAELLVPTKWILSFSESSNDEGLHANLDMLEECREIASIREAVNKQKISTYYDKRAKPMSSRIGDFVWRNNEASRAENTGKLRPTGKVIMKLLAQVQQALISLQDLMENEYVACNQFEKMLLIIVRQQHLGLITPLF